MKVKQIYSQQTRVNRLHLSQEAGLPITTAAFWLPWSTYEVINSDPIGSFRDPRKTSSRRNAISWTLTHGGVTDPKAAVHSTKPLKKFWRKCKDTKAQLPTETQDVVTQDTNIDNQFIWMHFNEDRLLLLIMMG